MNDPLMVWALMSAYSSGKLCPLPQKKNKGYKQSVESKQAAITKAEAKRQRRMENRKINNDIEV